MIAHDENDPVRDAILEGIAKIEASTPDEIKKYLDRKVLETAKRHAIFTTDEIHVLIAEDVRRPQNINGSAIGPALLRAKKAGVISRTGELQVSKRAEQHGKSIPQWLSLVQEVAA